MSALDEELALEEELRISRAQNGLLAFTQTTYGDKWKTNWHHRAICRAVNFLEHRRTPRELLASFGVKGKELQRQLATAHPVTKLFAGMTSPEMLDKPLRNLQVHVAPRHGKSEIISRRMPAWLLGRDPSLQIISCSYGAVLSKAMNRDVQRIIDDPKYQDLFPKTQLRGGAKEAQGQAGYLRTTDVFEIVGGKGFYKSAGVGGGITGMGANCFAAGTMVLTETGQAAIETFLLSKNKIRVWSYNHVTQKPQLCRVRAVRRLQSSGLITVAVAGCRPLTCTPDHLFCTGPNVYRPANSLRRREAIYYFARPRASHKTTLLLHSLQRKDKQGSWNVPSLLHEDKNIGSGVCVFLLRQRAYIADGRLSQKSKAKKAVICLQLRLQRRAEQSASGSANVQDMQTSSARSEQRKKILLCGMQSSAYTNDRTTKTRNNKKKHNTLRLVQNKISSLKLQSKVLFSLMRLYDTLKFYEGRKESILSRWWSRQRKPTKVFSLIQSDAISYFKKRLFDLRLVQKKMHRGRRSCAPYQLRYKRQRCSQLNYSVRIMSYFRSQTRNIKCTSIDSRGKIPQFVYDLQVEECHNFYANDILVHNCAIIDDPFKNRKQADSAIERQTVQDWYASTLYTRLERDAAQIIINTRWHERDLSGTVIAQALADKTAEQWFCLVFPAVLDCDPTPGDPRTKHGAALWPWKANEERLARIRASTSAYEFEALFQQRPAPPEGGIVKTSWFHYYDTLPDGLINWAISADLTFKERGDYMVLQVWAQKGASHYLIDQVRDRLPFTGQLRAFRALCQKYPQVRSKFVEEAANGAALIDTVKREIGSVIGIRPVGSKELRLDAVSPLIEAGNVYLPTPSRAPWVNDMLLEIAAFPAGAHDDTIDAMSQYLARVQKSFSYSLASAPISVSGPSFANKDPSFDFGQNL